jgi:hypothetical protein
MRSITQILLEGEKAKELQALVDLWNEIVRNKKKYPLTQIWFANKKIRERCLIVEGADIEKGKFYHALKQMDGS